MTIADTETQPVPPKLDAARAAYEEELENLIASDDQAALESEIEILQDLIEHLESWVEAVPEDDQ